uniref:SID1 transmembrane family member 1 n=1 Tax=Macrostomum lignano TaxID=282301 RepID=A0A1I8IUT2_9PLAT
HILRPAGGAAGDHLSADPAHQRQQQDICYYNFYCTRPLGSLTKATLNRTNRCLLGIPQHFGIFYAMGIALIMEGIMSGCYHVCPSYSNFQFDTGLDMYVLGRAVHAEDLPDQGTRTSTRRLIVACMAMAIVIFRQRGEVYYMGHWKVNVGLFRRFYLLISSQGIRCFKPMYKDRMVILVTANLINWTIAIFGAVRQPQDFNSFLLYIFLVNLLMYIAFYVVMKVRSGEKIRLLTTLFVVASCITWAAGLYFFMQRPSNWAKSPADSRTLNQRCLLLDFYDIHDIWHFLSSMSLFFSFMFVGSMVDILLLLLSLLLLLLLLLLFACRRFVDGGGLLDSGACTSCCCCCCCLATIFGAGFFSCPVALEPHGGRSATGKGFCDLPGFACCRCRCCSLGSSHWLRCLRLLLLLLLALNSLIFAKLFIAQNSAMLLLRRRRWRRCRLSGSSVQISVIDVVIVVAIAGQAGNFVRVNDHVTMRGGGCGGRLKLVMMKLMLGSWRRAWRRLRLSLSLAAVGDASIGQKAHQ